MNIVNESINAKSPLETRQVTNIHQGTLKALNGESIPNLE